ncbi:DUF397 domain-containing protein [Streptomyces sp. NPDC058442]|uniref:DUF397 domain-containing protein n=1 Tax=Streptomyces sp. NPDC058442 TaxID=3346503 RepID=UPI0036515607
MSTYGELDRLTSSYSGSEGDGCVEVAFAYGAVHVRDSKAQNGPRCAVSASAWHGFLERVRR